MRSESEGEGSEYDGEAMGAIPPNLYTVDGLLSAFVTLQAENEQLRSAALRGASGLPPETFYALTGFKSDALAREQFSLAGGDRFSAK